MVEGERINFIMNEKETIKTSKFLSLVLRHEPERVGSLWVKRAG